MITQRRGIARVPGEQNVDRWPAEWRAFSPSQSDRWSTAAGTPGRRSALSTTRTQSSRSSARRGAATFRRRESFGIGRSGAGRFGRHRKVRRRGAGNDRKRGRRRAGRRLDNVDGRVAGPTFPCRPCSFHLPISLDSGLAGLRTPGQWFTAGDVLDLTRHAELTSPLLGSGPKTAGDSGRLILEAPSGEKTRLSALGTNHLATLREQGLYELRGEATPIGGGRPIAVNVDPAEANLAHLDPAELVAAASANTTTHQAVDAGTAPPAQQEGRQTVWWYLLLGALFLMAIETVMSNRLSRAMS